MAATLTAKLEDYLEAIVGLVDVQGVARVRDIAAAVSVHKSTVTSALRSLARRGLIHYRPYQFVTLTPEGEALGRKVASRHGAIRRFLTDVLNVDEAVASENACRMEHVMDSEVLDRLVRFGRLARASSAGRAGSRHVVAGGTAGRAAGGGRT